MKLLQMFFAVVVLALLSGCSSKTMMNSVPQGAKLYMDDQYKGLTPFLYSDTKIVGTSTRVRLEREGYQAMNTLLVRNERADVAAIVTGCFFLVPFLWTMEYDHTHTYELLPLSPTPTDSPASGMTKEKADALREVRKLYDDGTLSKEEYEVQKQKILDGK